MRIPLICFITCFFLGIVVSNAQKLTSKYDNGVEINKGMKFSSLTFSLTAKDAVNENQLFTYMVKQNKNNFQIRLDPGYVIKKNLAVGIGLLYGIQKDMNTARASDGTITDNKSLERDFAFRPFVKNFLPIGNSHKFYIVIPTELQLGYGSKLTEATTNAILTRSHTTAYYYGIEMRPGLLAFIVKNFGFEVNVGAFGLSSSFEKTSTTGQPDTEVKNNALNLKINVLQLSLGFALYL